MIKLNSLLKIQILLLIISLILLFIIAIPSKAQYYNPYSFFQQVVHVDFTVAQPIPPARGDVVRHITLVPGDVV